MQRWIWGSIPSGTEWQDRLLATFNGKLKALENFLGLLVGLAVGRKVADVDSATPSVSGVHGITFANTAPTTVTSFRNGEPGQPLIVLALDNDTTVQHGSSIRLNGNADWVVKKGETRSFWTPDAVVWYEVPRALTTPDA